jgi:hypothetical protein
VEGEQFGDASRSAAVPRDVGRDGASFEDGEHVLDPVCVLRVLLQNVKKARVHSVRYWNVMQKCLMLFTVIALQYLYKIGGIGASTQCAVHLQKVNVGCVLVRNLSFTEGERWGLALYEMCCHPGLYDLRWL